MSRRACILLAAAASIAGCGHEPSGEDRAAHPSEVTPSSPAVAPLSASAIESTSADGTYLARWEPDGGTLPDAEPFTARFSVRRSDGKAIAADAVFAVDAEMPQHGHGMNLVPTVVRVGVVDGAVIVAASGILFHMPGRWVLAFDVGEDGISERTQWFVDVQ